VGESASLTTAELAMRGQCPTLFLSPEEREKDRLLQVFMNLKVNKRVDALVEHAEERVGVRKQINEYMKTITSQRHIESASDNSAVYLQMFQKRAAIEALGCVAMRGDMRVLTRCQVWIEDANWAVRSAAAATIGRLLLVNAGELDLLSALCKRLKVDTDPSVRTSAATALADCCENHLEPCTVVQNSIGALFGALEDEDSWVRLAAERALCICMKAMHESDNADSSCGQDYGVVFTQLAHGLSHSDRFVRDASRAALKGAGILKESVCVQTINNDQLHMSRQRLLMARALAKRAQDTGVARECRAEACQALLTYGLWAPFILPAAELHGYRLWKSELLIRRNAIHELCELANETKNRPDIVAGSSYCGIREGVLNEEHINNESILVEMLSAGLDNFDLEVRRCALIGLEKLCQHRGEKAAHALAEMLKIESNYENVSRGMLLLMQNDPAAAREAIPCLVGHADTRVRDAARECEGLLKNDVGLILRDLEDKIWVNRLECLKRLSSICSRRGVQLLHSKLLHDCRKSGYGEGDCVLAVLDWQLCLDCCILEMREAAAFVHKDGVKVEDEATWKALETVFSCRIELIDACTLRTMRCAAACEGALVHIVILNGHAFSASHDDVTRLRDLQTSKHSWDNELVSAISKLLEDENHFVRHSATRALGDIACVGDSCALRALMHSFRSAKDCGLCGITMASICKLCTIENQDALDFMFSNLESSDPAVCLPIYVTVAEMLLNEVVPPTSGPKFFEICQRLLLEKSDKSDECIMGARKWALSLLDERHRKDTAEDERKAARAAAQQAKREEKKRKREHQKALLAKRREMALNELKSDAVVRRFDGLAVLGGFDDLDPATIKAIANALNDEYPRVRIRAMGLLRRYAKSDARSVAMCVDALTDIIRRRETDLSVHAVCLLGDVVPTGCQDVISFLLDQLNIQKTNYLGAGQRRCVWDRVTGFRQSVLQTLFRIMPGSDSKAFVTKLAFEDLDSTDTQKWDAAFEVVAAQVSDDVVYTLVLAKMVDLLRSKQCDKRQFAIKSLQVIGKPQDMRILLALIKILEDKDQDEETRILAAQAMLHIDADDVGVRSAIRGVILSGESDTDSLIESARSTFKVATETATTSTCHTFRTFPVSVTGTSFQLLSSRLALVLACFCDVAVPLEQDSKSLARNSTTLVDGAVDLEFQKGVQGEASKEEGREKHTARLSKTVMLVPRSLSKMGRAADGRLHIVRTLPGVQPTIDSSDSPAAARPPLAPSSDKAERYEGLVTGAWMPCETVDALRRVIPPSERWGLGKEENAKRLSKSPHGGLRTKEQHAPWRRWRKGTGYVGGLRKHYDIMEKEAEKAVRNHSMWYPGSEPEWFAPVHTDLNGKEWCVADAALLVRAGSEAFVPAAQTLDDDFDV
jgi:HEAT repeat protein